MTIPTSDRSFFLLLWFDRDRHLGDVGAARDVHDFDDMAMLDAVVGIDHDQELGIFGEFARPIGSAKEDLSTGCLSRKIWSFFIDA